VQAQTLGFDAGALTEEHALHFPQNEIASGHRLRPLMRCGGGRLRVLCVRERRRRMALGRLGR
jgi:hypothetical protein